MSGKWVLVTGGIGYIGSHVAVEMCLRGFNVIVVDNLHTCTDVNRCTSIRNILQQHKCQSEIHFTYKDLEREALWIPRKCDFIIHLAAYKSVPESVADPLRYYSNNINALLKVLECAKQWRNQPVFIFSSSATVYGDVTEMPLTERSPTAPTNPYGHTKLMCEQILSDAVRAERPVISNAVMLRYFNPVGAHPSGLIGESVAASSALNLMPVLLQALRGERDHVQVFGTDYPTPDGTAVRDYIHVMDLAEAHIAACERADTLDPVEVINLGRGRGVSVAEMIGTLEKVVGQKVPVQMCARREGDAATSFTSCQRAKDRLKWEATRGVEDMCRDAARAAGIKTTDT